MPLAFDTFDEDLVRNELEEGIAKANGGVLELVLRDTHTCRYEPERFGKWVEIARRTIDEYWEA